ncbi:acetoacetate decarboxylase family protein [Nonomuraea sp. NPDC046570]|uniref:acetoacetate decarboxylase family protein n=1 Tax=Nonomuraea sp. NPDC046570 TaxID=3155255 RepID=UPI003401B694
MAVVRGFYPPKTATGRSALVPGPPWFYSGDLLTVEYRTHPDRVAELLPEPLDPAPEDPGAVAVIWADWQSCAQDGEELLDPVRAQYKECFVVVRCAYRGRTYSRCVYIWVDKDFAVARGVHQGYPKKLGSIHQTRPHPYGRAAPRLAPGGTFGATLAAADRRLAQAVVRLREPSEHNGFVNAHPMAHHRWLPSIEPGGGLALDELVASSGATFEGGGAWAGEARIELFEAPTEELAALEVEEVIGGYYRQVGVSWNGGTLLESGTSGAR